MTWTDVLAHPPYTVLQAPVPALEGFVRGRLERWAPDFLRIDGGVQAHVTVVAPFFTAQLDAAVTADLALLLAGRSAFTTTFGRLARFADGLAYAAPEASEPWLALTQAIVDRWPEQRPYCGDADVVPHLSLDYAEPAALASELALPVTQCIDRVELVVYEPHRTRALATFPLGLPPAASR